MVVALTQEQQVTTVHSMGRLFGTGAMLLTMLLPSAAGCRPFPEFVQVMESENIDSLRCNGEVNKAPHVHSFLTFAFLIGLVRL